MKIELIAVCFAMAFMTLIIALSVTIDDYWRDRISRGEEIEMDAGVLGTATFVCEQVPKPRGRVDAP